MERFEWFMQTAMLVLIVPTIENIAVMYKGSLGYGVDDFKTAMLNIIVLVILLDIALGLYKIVQSKFKTSRERFE